MLNSGFCSMEQQGFKGALSWGFLFFWMRNADTQNALRTLREKESNDFLKGKTNLSQFLAIFPGTKEKLENISLNYVFKLQSISIPVKCSQTHLIIYSENW